MAALNLGGAIALAVWLPSLAMQGMLVALGRALRTYSRTRLEEVCEAQRPAHVAPTRSRTTTRPPNARPSPWRSSAA